VNFVGFFVLGHPEPGGSKNAYPVAGRVRVVDANRKLKPWQKTVRQVAKGAMLREREPPIEGPVSVEMRFYRKRPKSHHTGTGKPSAEFNRHPWPTSKPDVLKLARGVEDALTGIVYKDDAQIVWEKLYKEWGEPEGVRVNVTPL
jgi:Holliday junction resolvase RusA-like endonuclease